MIKIIVQFSCWLPPTHDTNVRLVTARESFRSLFVRFLLQQQLIAQNIVPFKQKRTNSHLHKSKPKRLIECTTDLYQGVAELSSDLQLTGSSNQSDNQSSVKITLPLECHLYVISCGYRCTFHFSY